MSNMSYCQFENTANDLQQVYETLEEGNGKDEKLSKYEKAGKARLIQLCYDIIALMENEQDEQDEEENQEICDDEENVDMQWKLDQESNEEDIDENESVEGIDY